VLEDVKKSNEIFKTNVNEVRRHFIFNTSNCAIMSPILFFLSKFILTPVWRDFINLEDLCRLDTAMSCSKMCIDPFKQSLVYIRQSFFSVIKVSKCLKSWLESRSMKLLVEGFCSFERLTEKITSVAITHSKFEMFCDPPTLFNMCKVCNLTSLSFHGAVWLTDRILIEFLSTIPRDQLLVVDLTGCVKLTIKSVCKIANFCSSLQSISIANIYDLSPDAIWSFTSLTSITSINFQNSISQARTFDGRVYGALSVLFVHNTLREVNILQCGDYAYGTLSLIEFYPENSAMIVKLVLSNSIHMLVLDSHIQSLCHTCPLMEELVLHNLCHLTMNAIVIIGQNLKRLRILSCPGLKNSDIIARIFEEIFELRYSVDFCEMRMVGVIRSSFKGVSKILADRIRRRRINDIFNKQVAYSDWVEMSMEGFGRAMRTHFCADLTSIVVGWWPAHYMLTSSAILPRMMDLASACTSLTELNIVNSNVDNNGLVAFGMGSTRLLRVLRLSNCEVVGDAGVIALIDANLATLAVVDIDGCHRDLSDVCLQHVQKCVGLREFRIHGQQSVTMAGVFALRVVNPRLQVFDVYRCKKCICWDQKVCKCYL
jgi:hypothetical protein